MDSSERIDYCEGCGTPQVDPVAICPVCGCDNGLFAHRGSGTETADPRLAEARSILNRLNAIRADVDDAVEATRRHIKGMSE